MWETNFVPDLGAFSLPEWEARGVGSRNIKFILADSAMHAHTSEMPVGTYKKAHRHGPGAHVFAVTGTGYSLMWMDGESHLERHEWRHGWVFAPPEDMFHQHFNTGTTPARYMALSLGSHRYPVLARKVARKQDPERAIKDGGLQLDYEDQDPRIHRIWLAEMKNWAMLRKSLRSRSKRPLSSAILNTRLSTPFWTSLRLSMRLRSRGPISEIVVRTGWPCSPKTSQKAVG